MKKERNTWETILLLLYSLDINPEGILAISISSVETQLPNVIRITTVSHHYYVYYWYIVLIRAQLITPGRLFYYLLLLLLYVCVYFFEYTCLGAIHSVHTFSFDLFSFPLDSLPLRLISTGSVIKNDDSMCINMWNMSDNNAIVYFDKHQTFPFYGINLIRKLIFMHLKFWLKAVNFTIFLSLSLFFFSSHISVFDYSTLGVISVDFNSKIDIDQHSSTYYLKMIEEMASRSQITNTSKS